MAKGKRHHKRIKGAEKYLDQLKIEGKPQAPCSKVHTQKNSYDRRDNKRAVREEN